MMNTADRVEFTKEMRDYTILAPNMADIHFSLFAYQHLFLSTATGLSFSKKRRQNGC